MGHLIRVHTVCNSVFLTETSIWNNGSDNIQRWKSPLQKLGDERVKSGCNNMACMLYSEGMLTPLACRPKQVLLLKFVDPDEVAHNKLSHQDLHCLPF